jgi:hypothetical protein
MKFQLYSHCDSLRAEAIGGLFGENMSASCVLFRFCKETSEGIRGCRSSSCLDTISLLLEFSCLE